MRCHRLRGRAFGLSVDCAEVVPSPLSAPGPDILRRGPALMPDERRQSEIDLAVVRRDVEWIRDLLGGTPDEPGLVHRVSDLEKGHDQIMGAIRTITSSVLLIGALFTAAHTIGLL